MHFVREPYARTLGKPWAMATARLTSRKTLTVPATITIDGIERPNISVAKSDTEWTRLPDDIRVLDGDGELISPSAGRCFYVTVATIDPFHGLCEADPRDM